MAIKVWREGDDVKVKCEECGFFLCPMQISSKPNQWEAIHPSPTNGLSSFPLFYDCVNQGQVVKGVI